MEECLRVCASRVMPPNQPMDEDAPPQLVVLADDVQPWSLSSMSDLDELMSDPDKMRIQSLVFREAILGTAHPDTSFYIRYRGAVYADSGSFDRCISLWTYALDMQQRHLSVLCPMTQSSFISFAELFCHMLSDGDRRALLDHRAVVDILTRAVSELCRHTDSDTPVVKTGHDEHRDQLGRAITIILHFLALLTKMADCMTSDQMHHVKKLVYNFVKLGLRGEGPVSAGQSPLHMSCVVDTSTIGRYPVCDFPCPSTVTLLLDTGHPPDVLDDRGDTPLHVALADTAGYSVAIKARLVKSLLAGGAHLDRAAGSGRSSQEVQVAAAECGVQPLQHGVTLQCLAARCVSRHHLDTAHLTPDLKEFVTWHC